MVAFGGIIWYHDFKCCDFCAALFPMGRTVSFPAMRKEKKYERID